MKDNTLAKIFAISAAGAIAVSAALAQTTTTVTTDAGPVTAGLTTRTGSFVTATPGDEYFTFRTTPAAEPGGFGEGLVAASSGSFTGVRVLGAGARLRLTPEGRMQARIPEQSAPARYVLMVAHGSRSGVSGALAEGGRNRRE